jgi:hypothetical protein
MGGALGEWVAAMKQIAETVKAPRITAKSAASRVRMPVSSGNLDFHAVA